MNAKLNKRSSIGRIMHEKEKFQLRKTIKELENYKGRHTELVTVYVPAGYGLNEIINMLRNEVGTAENIKSKSVRKNVTTSIDKIVRHLMLYKGTPPNGLAIFCGNVSEHEGDSDIKIWAIEPPEPLKTKLYWCSQRFDVEPLREMIAEKEIYGIICLDRQEADIALLVGKKIKPIMHADSIVPGKTRAGGQSSQRFSRVREGLLNDWLKQIADAANKIFTEHKEVIGILLSGSGPIKDEFAQHDSLHADVKKKILGTVDTSSTGENGLEETLMRGEAMIKETEIMKEKTFLQKFLNEIPRPSTLAVYGINETIHALTIGALEMLILSEAAEYKEIEYECGCGKKKVFALNKPATCKECCQPTRLISQRDAEEVIEELSQNFGTKFQLVSADTREGQQFLALGGIGGFLRYRL